jgi:AhpD family alkylhydroperoxidase
MATDFLERHSELLNGFRQLRRAAPDVMAGFNELHRSAMADGAVSTKHKELTAVGIAVAGQCQGCIALHVHAALKAGASKAELRETVGVAILMGGGPAAVYGAEALEGFEQFTSDNPPTGNSATQT